MTAILMDGRHGSRGRREEATIAAISRSSSAFKPPAFNAPVFQAPVFQTQVSYTREPISAIKIAARTFHIVRGALGCNGTVPESERSSSSLRAATTARASLARLLNV